MDTSSGWDLVVLGSGLFVEDVVLNLSRQFSSDMYFNNLQLVQNAVDWAAEDLDLLSIRARGSATRVLLPMQESTQTFWEVFNYAVALVALPRKPLAPALRRARSEPTLAA